MLTLALLVVVVALYMQYTVKNEQDRFYPTTLGLALVDGYDNIGEQLFVALRGGSLLFLLLLLLQLQLQLLLLLSRCSCCLHHGGPRAPFKHTPHLLQASTPTIAPPVKPRAPLPAYQSVFHRLASQSINQSPAVSCDDARDARRISDERSNPEGGDGA